MFIFKNSMKNIVRNKGRNILLAVIMFVIIVSTVVALAINNTATAIINDYRERFSSEVIISLNIESFMGDGQNWQPGQTIEIPEIEPITSQMYLKYGESQYLDQAKNTYTATVYCISDDVTPLENLTMDGGGGRPGGGFAGGGFAMQTGDFILYGDYWNDFNNGDRWLVAGEWNDRVDECLISSDLADENGLIVGDTFVIKYELTDSDGVTDTIEYNLTVAGIYYDNTDSFGRVNRRNEIMTNFATAVAPLDDGRATNGITVNATYYLKDPNDLAKFEAEIRNMGTLSLPDIYSVTTDSATYNQIVQPVLSLKNISLIFLIVILVLGGVILTVLAMIAIRERKYEIGTLRAIGMKKSKIFAGLLTEIMAITCVCLMLGFMVGYFVSQPVSDALLNQQIEAAQTQTQQGPGGGMFGGSGNRPNFDQGQGGMQSQARPGTEALGEMKITFGAVTILEIFGIVILLAAAPTAISAARITKYEPMKILAERN
jgi:putative ABC transport system permease protein